MAAGEGGEYQFAAIGMALGHRQLVAVFDRLDHLVDVREVEPRADALRIKVERHGHEAAVAGALTIAEQAALDAVGPGHQAQLGRGDTGAAIVMGVQADHRALPVGEVAAEILNLIGVDIGRRRLDRGGEVEDDRMLGRRHQHRHHRLAALDREIELGGGEGLGAIFEMPLGLREPRRLIAQHFRPARGNLAHLRPVHPEHDAPPQRRDRVVEMDDRGMRAGEAFERSLDQILARLGQHLHQHVFRDAPAIDQPADEIVLGRPGGGEADLDLLEPDLEQEIEEAGLLLRAHRIDQRLVAVAQIGRQPARGLGDSAARPLPVGQGDLGEGTVLDRRIVQHGHDRLSGCLWRRCSAVAVPLQMGGSGSPGRHAHRTSRRVSSRPRADKSQGQGRPEDHGCEPMRIGLRLVKGGGQLNPPWAETAGPAGSTAGTTAARQAPRSRSPATARRN